MRTLLRPGRRGLLVKLEGRRGTRFLVAGDGRKQRRVFFTLQDAVRSFEGLENSVWGEVTPKRLPSFAFLRQTPFQRPPSPPAQRRATPV